MDMSRRVVFILVTIVVCILAFSGCKNDLNSVSYGDVVYDSLDVLVINDNGALVTDDNIYIDLLKTYEDADSVLTGIGVSQSALSVYDENYFADKDLLVIAFSTNPDYEYTIKNLDLNGNSLTVNIDEKIPKAHNLLKVYKAILIDVSKDDLPENVETEVKINSIVK